MKKRLLPVTFLSGKLVLLLIFFTSFTNASVLAPYSDVQYKSVHEVIINVKFKDATIQEVLQQIERQTDYVFQYYPEDIAGFNNISVAAGRISVGELLYKVSKQAYLKFRQVNNNIAVARRKSNEKKAMPVEVVAKINIKGVVRDEAGEPLTGVTVLVKGTTTGTITDIDGAYKLSVEEDATLVFSFLGYKSGEVSVLGRAVIDFSMEPDVTSLQELVVVGYGEAERRKLTESVSVVDASKIENVPLTSFDNILQGAATGVQVVSGGGQPGSGVAVRVRGISSITGNRAPLYVVDGVPINGGDSDGNLTEDAQTGNALASINPNDIASLTILKDASATSIYGSRGTNGVVLITTKKGTVGKPKIKYSAQYGYTEFENPNNFSVMNSTEYIEYMREAAINAGINPDAQTMNGAPNPDFFPLRDTINTDWVDAVMQTGQVQQHNLSVSGGNESTQYFASFGYYEEEGIVRNTGIERISGRLNLTQKVDEKLSIGFNVTMSNADQNNRTGSGTSFSDPIYGAFFLSPLYPIFANEEQIAAGTDYGTGFNFNTPGFSGHNTVASLALNSNSVQTFRTIGNLSASYQILPNLKARSSFGIDRVDITEEEFSSPNYESGRTQGRESEGSGLAHSIVEFDWVSTNTLQYEQNFGQDHTFNLLLGNEVLQSVTNRNRAFGVGFATDRLRTLNSAARADNVDTDWSKWNLVSFFAKANYSFKNKLFVNASARRDGSSRFAPSNRWGNFWALGLAYDITQESFMDKYSFLDYLKLKTSIGTQGNNNIGNFAWLTSYAYTANLNFNGQAVSGNRPSSLGDENIQWEQQLTIDAGIDVSFFNNRLNLSVAFYQKRISDMLFDVPLSRTTGFNNLETNAGEMHNTGWEFELSSVNINKGGFSWTTDFQFSTFRNEIIDLPNVDEFVDTGDNIINRVGEPVNEWYMPRWGGVDPSNGQPLWYTENGSLTSDYGQAAFEIVGSQLPDFFGSFNNTITYKGFSITANFYYNYGNDVYREVQRFLSSDGARFGRNQDRRQLNRWQKPGDITDVPRIAKGNGDGGFNHSSRYLEDGSFIKLRSLMVAYNLPAKWLDRANLSQVRIYAQGFNMRTWTNFRGLDPETGDDSRDFGEYPNPRKVIFGIDITL